MNLIKKTFGLLGCIAFSSALFAATTEQPLNGFTDFNSKQYYIEHAANVTSQDWLAYITKNYTLTSNQEKELAGLHYYLRLNPNIDTSKITETVSTNNPANVNLFIELVPKSNFTKTFPSAKDGSRCSYLNLLKSIALMPGLFSDFKDFKQITGIDPTPEMKNPELVWRKFFSAIMSNAVQETSNSGTDKEITFDRKLSGTFNVTEEICNPDYTKKVATAEGNGQYLWGENGLWRLATVKDITGPFDVIRFSPPSGYSSTDPNDYNCNLYGGRGVHQVTYQYNYANNSLFLYQDLRLMKYPELVASKSILPWLTTLVYCVIPMSNKPSIVELFDGQWKRHLDSINDKTIKKTDYENEIAMTVALINGLECGKEGKNGPNHMNTLVRCSGYYEFYLGIGVGETLFSNIAKPYNVQMPHDDEMLNACFAIEPTKIASDPLKWPRPFLINDKVKIVDIASDYYIFGGVGSVELMEGPKGQFINHDYYKPTEVALTLQDVKDLLENDPGKTNHPEQKVSLTKEDKVDVFVDDKTYDAGSFVTYNGQLWYVAWGGVTGKPFIGTPKAYNSPWRVQGTIVNK